MTPAELQAKPGIPVFVKKRNMLDLNEIEDYLQELRKRAKK